MNLPRKPEDLWPFLVSLGVALATTKLLLSREALTVRRVFGRALEAALLAMCAGVGLLVLPDADPFAVLGVGGLLASLGRSGIIKVLSALRPGRGEE